MGKVSNKNTNEYPVPEGSYLYLARKIADGVFASRKLPFEAAIQQIIESHTDDVDPHPQYATQAAFAAHAADTGNPHGVTAAQVGADPTGTADGQVAAHEAAADPHPQYVVTWAAYNNGAAPSASPEANFTDALALGSGGIAGATYSFSFLGNVTGSGGISIGYNSLSSTGQSIGQGAQGGSNAFVGGLNAIGTGPGAVCVGPSSRSDNTNTTSVGAYADAGGAYAGAFCAQSNASGSEAVAIGRNTDATANFTFAGGRGAQATSVYAIAFTDCTISHAWSVGISPGGTSWHNYQTITRTSYQSSTQNEQSVIAIDNAGSTNTSRATQLTLPANSNCFIEANAICVNTTSGEVQAKKFTALVVTDGTTATIAGTVDEVSKETASLGLTSFGFAVSSGLVIEVAAVHATDNIKLRTYFTVTRTSD